MSRINARVSHGTVEPRLEREKTVERVVIEGQDKITVRFTRVGECVDVWQFEELSTESETFSQIKPALTREVAHAILKSTPCVSIRDKDNNTIAGIEYSDELRHQTSFYTIEE